MGNPVAANKNWLNVIGPTAMNMIRSAYSGSPATEVMPAGFLFRTWTHWILNGFPEENVCGRIEYTCLSLGKWLSHAFFVLPQVACIA